MRRPGPGIVHVLSEGEGVAQGDDSTNPGRRHGGVFRHAPEAFGVGVQVDRPFVVQNMLRQAGVGLTVQQALMGHSSMQMTEHYSSVNGDEKREAVAKVISLMAYKEVKEESA